MKLQKQKKTITLYCLCGKITITDQETGEVVGAFVDLPDSCRVPGYWPNTFGNFDWNKYSYETEFPLREGTSSLNLGELLPKLNEVYEQNKDLYERIELDCTTFSDDVSFPSIIGIRDETDEEFVLRLEMEKQQKLMAEQEKLQKKQEKLDKKREQFERLKKELGE